MMDNTLNSKKLELAYKKYNKNFENSKIYENSKLEYAEIKSKVVEITEANDKENDHILLVDIDTIFNYYLLTWKSDLLMNDSNRIDGLKQMQIALFYECVTQDLYKVRWPDMLVLYTLKDVVATLIHFTMYGWEKEENILFDFIAEHLDENAMSANDWNKHTWFLLEIYLQYRNKEIFGTNHDLYITVKKKLNECERENDFIPEDLDIYNEVLERWSTPDVEEITTLLRKMIIYHSKLASNIGKSMEFGDYRYGFYPYESYF